MQSRLTESYQIINQNCNSKILLVCDHATNRIPEKVSANNLGLNQSDLSRHIAYDIGAKETAMILSEQLKSPLICANFSRLVIDPNRSENDPTSIMQLYDGSIIPGNINLSKKDISYRKNTFYRAYHFQINEFVNKKIKFGEFLSIISIHSFTPKLRKGPVRPWKIGILWDTDTRLSKLLVERLRARYNVCVGENKPYSGKLDGDTMHRHATSNGLPHTLIEFRNDLIADKKGQEKWAKKIAGVLQECVKIISN